MWRANCLDSVKYRYYIDVCIYDHRVQISHNIALSLNVTRPPMNDTVLDNIGIIVHQTTAICSTYSLVAG